jgi:hypothetical protein
MAWTPIDHTSVDRPEISRAAYGYPTVDNLNDLHTRTGVLETRTTDVNTGNTALGTRTTALETTVNAAGTTAAGNAALSSRLGTGVTTSSTATSQLTTLGNRATALESVQGKKGRWYSSSTSTFATSTPAIGSWNGVGTPMSDISVSGTTWTVNTAGTYLITAQYHGTMSETLNTGGNTNFFIAKTDLSAVYAQSQGYRVQYQSGAIEVSDNLSSGPIDLTAGTQFSVYLGSATPVGITLSNSLQRTFCAIKRVA